MDSCNIQRLIGPTAIFALISKSNVRHGQQLHIASLASVFFISCVFYIHIFEPIVKNTYHKISIGKTISITSIFTVEYLILSHPKVINMIVRTFGISLFGPNAILSIQIIRSILFIIMSGFVFAHVGAIEHFEDSEKSTRSQVPDTMGGNSHELLLNQSIVEDGTDANLYANVNWQTSEEPSSTNVTKSVFSIDKTQPDKYEFTPVTANEQQHFTEITLDQETLDHNSNSVVQPKGEVTHIGDTLSVTPVSAVTDNYTEFVDNDIQIKKQSPKKVTIDTKSVAKIEPLAMTDNGFASFN